MFVDVGFLIFIGVGLCAACFAAGLQIGTFWGEDKARRERRT